MFERLALHNYDIRTRSVRLKIEFGADFADIFEVRGTPRAARGEMRAPVVEASSVTLSYLGLDDRERETHLQFEPAPDQIDSESAAFSIQLAPGERRTLFIAIRCGVGRDARSPRRAFFSCLREARKSLRQSASRAAAISTSNEVFNETVRRAVSDLYMLVTDTPYGPYPYAGIPWFSTVFGRDALITALQTLWLDPEIAHGVLRYLAAHQATDIDEAADAEPGKILHEMRFGEMAELREVPFQLLLRERRRDAALCHPRRRLPAADRRCRDATRDLGQCGSGADLARQLWRPRRRRLRRIRTPQRQAV